MSSKKEFNLSDFKKDIKLGTKDFNIQAFDMDDDGGKKHWGIYASLNTPKCCDYLFVRDNSLVLIEEKQLKGVLKKKINKAIDENLSDQNISKIMKHYGLTVEDQRKIFHEIQKKTYDENLARDLQVKVYGSILILQTLRNVYKNTEEILGNKNVKYFYFFSGIERDNIRILDRVQGHLIKFLEGLAIEVKIFPITSEDKDLEKILN